MDEDVIAVLQRAKERVAVAWTKGQPMAGYDCAGSAIGRACGMSMAEWSAAERVFLMAIDRTHPCDIALWNDAPRRTQVEVLDAFDAAILLAKSPPAARAGEATDG